jgi:hypothetical protein
LLGQCREFALHRHDVTFPPAKPIPADFRRVRASLPHLQFLPAGGELHRQPMLRTVRNLAKWPTDPITPGRITPGLATEWLNTE